MKFLSLPVLALLGSYAFAAERPNILFCMADDWGWPHASVHIFRITQVARNVSGIGLHTLRWAFLRCGQAWFTLKMPSERDRDWTLIDVFCIKQELFGILRPFDKELNTIFPRGDTPDDEGRKRNDEVNKIIQTYVDNETIHWLDLSHVFVDDQGNLNRDLMPDRLHPNEQGYRAWAEAMEPTIKKFLGEDTKE